VAYGFDKSGELHAREWMAFDLLERCAIGRLSGKFFGRVEL
jgi:hypothetical protein